MFVQTKASNESLRMHQASARAGPTVVAGDSHSDYSAAEEGHHRLLLVPELLPALMRAIEKSVSKA